MLRNPLFKCPSLGVTVQGRIEDAHDNERGDDFQEVKCPACGSVHFLNSKTGKILGER